MKNCLTILFASIVTAALFGCGDTATPATSSGQLTTVSIDASKYALAEEPEGAIGVIAARESAKDGESIVVVGRIGGASNPWIEGRAAFVLLDASMMLVANGTDSAQGEICLDDCCAQERAASTTLVKVVDSSGQVLAVDARKLLNVTENDMIVVHGKVNKDQAGNFVVLADGVHVRR